jgi:DNA-binding transcriptional ArsR family regulator
MIEKKIKNNVLFIYNEDLELMLAALNILQGEQNHKHCSKIFGEETIENLKKKYHFLFEIFESIQVSTGFFEHLLSYPLESFSLKDFKDFLLSMDNITFINCYFEIQDVEKVRKALDSEEYLEKLYFERKEISNNYIGFQSFINNSERVIKEYFALSEELRTEAFNMEFKSSSSIVKCELEKSIKSLDNMDPLEYSQVIMGKTFYNRGPYAEFIFSPSLYVPYRALRYFADRQILFYSIRPKPIEDETILKQLKTIADSTRLKIISLLNEKEPLRGLDIVGELSLASSTVSHHMDQLKSAGLINEEQVKNSKYYSINRNSVDELLKILTATLNKN